ncbi:RNA polymerase recycling motor ATPase HelR [Actinoplanes sp. NBRC 103695]|uniref:RNA polymerase recycling motor ATPase HelR n=1 Tax=Actinoplanes sp. NBRC 103695 TaxID=3032202 RepID=UPI0024A2D2DA|nr:RNA polymerase recycling motor ATPase HelR [Actinoplanes sp. NBRC 103695]GLY93438.1 DNA helicase [Actinoplanes sp. NBRC 103695]
MLTTVFDLKGAKDDPALIDQDEKHFAAMAASIEQSITDLSARLEAQRKAPAGKGRQAVDRDEEVQRLTSRLRTLRRYSLDLCLGRIHRSKETVYIGRLGLTDQDGRRLLVDWRSPAAEPFFAATHANPQGLVSRRRYRWTRGRITDFWDEVFTPEGFESTAALDDQSAFIASLGSTRSPRMRDVLGTIQADQDAIIRAGSGGALVVDGGPGTGKTVVALHRTAYLLYSDPRLGQRHGGVLFVGPHQPYLAYVSDVLPSLGEEDVQTCTLRDLLPEGAAARPETGPEVARLKSSADMVTAIETAVRFYEEPPAGRKSWAEAFASVSPGTPHNEAREEIWEELVAMDEEADRRELRTALNRAWPMLDPAELIGDLWSVPAYLRRCAPWLTKDQVRLLQRTDVKAWTLSDLPLLDAARQRLGDAEAARRDSRRTATEKTERRRMDRVLDDLIASNEFDDGEGLMTMLRQQDLRDVLVDEAAMPHQDPDVLAGPFAHVVVDEAQELTDAEWQMLLRRCPSRSFTIVGDRAQARNGFAESWRERLERIGLSRIELATLTINYRTPAEIMAEAEPVIRAALPDANVPTSIRTSGVPVVHGVHADLDAILDEHTEGTACLIGATTDRPGVRNLTPELAKGLEFDLVVLVDPERWSAVDRYVAMTRATGRLAILEKI